MQIRAVPQHFDRFQYKLDHWFIIRQAEVWDKKESKQLSIISKTDRTYGKIALNVNMVHISAQHLSKFIIHSYLSTEYI
jgi:hypothetical protein